MQYFFLVAYQPKNVKTIHPLKIFLQGRDAKKWGRRVASMNSDDSEERGDYIMFRQPITSTGTIEYVETLYPFKDIIDSDIDADR